MQKKDMIFIRKAIWPLREVISYLDKSETDLVSSKTKIYIRDLYDHAIQIMDAIESFRDIASGLLDIYLSSLSNKMNEIMKTLTIFAAIFIPLTFIAGVYGMNFKHMPELECRYGYPIIIILMFLVGISLVSLFRRKKMALIFD